MVSRVLRNGKFSMEDIQRSSLAGGIAMASCTSFLVSPGGAMVTGIAAALFSTFARVWLQPALQR
jgi:ammonia channel protein AmtB